MFGFLNIDKPAGPTSHDIVARVRRLLPRKTKVGHAGTLDPFASGVLVVCVGPATRLAEYVQRQPKRYRAQVTLGATSTTDDSEGSITASDASPATPRQAGRSDVQDALAKFVGPIEQVPPAHSAVHVQGRRAYQLARAGKEVCLAPRTVAIHEIRLLRYDWPTLEIEVHCSRGTYIRALARDLGQALGTGGYCSALQRTAVGDFTLDSAVTMDALSPADHLLPPRLALDLPTVSLDESQIAHLRHGREIPLLTPPPPDTDEIALLDTEGNLLGLARWENQHLRPGKVLLAL